MVYKNSKENALENITNDQSGQTFIEFVLLLSSIVVVAFTFMRLTNTNLGNKWEKMATVILDDNSRTLKVH